LSLLSISTIPTSSHLSSTMADTVAEISESICAYMSFYTDMLIAHIKHFGKVDGGVSSPTMLSIDSKVRHTRMTIPPPRLHFFLRLSVLAVHLSVNCLRFTGRWISVVIGDEQSLFLTCIVAPFRVWTCSTGPWIRPGSGGSYASSSIPHYAATKKWSNASIKCMQPRRKLST
jgi:hypothetical protein